MISPRLVLPLLLVSASAYADSKAWTTGKAVIPANMQIVGGIDGASLRNSKLFQSMAPMMWMKAGDAKATLDGIKSDCNIDVITAIDSIAFGLDANQSGVIVVALKGTTRKDLETCAGKRAKAEGKTFTAAAEGKKLTKYTGVSDQTVYVQWLANDVVAMATASDDKDASLKLLAGGVTKDAAMKTALGNVSRTATVWGVYNKAEDIGTADAPGHMSLAYGSATFVNGNIDAVVHAVLADAKEATGQAASLNKQVADMKKGGAPPALAGVLKTLALKADGSEVVATASIPQDDVFGLIGAAMRGK